MHARMPAVTASVTLRITEGLLGRVDAAAAARGLSRNSWLLWAAELALGESDSGDAVGRNPTPAQQPDIRVGAAASRSSAVVDVIASGVDGRIVSQRRHASSCKCPVCS